MLKINVKKNLLKNPVRYLLSLGLAVGLILPSFTFFYSSPAYAGPEDCNYLHPTCISGQINNPPASSIPPGCPGGPVGPALPGTECPGGNASGKAGNYCQARHSSNAVKRNACKKGFQAGYNGGNKSNACSSYSGNIKSACNAGFNGGKNTKRVENQTPPAGSNGGNANGGQGTEDIKCEASAPTISWIVCAVIDFGANFTNQLFKSFLTPLLEDIPVSLNPNEGSFQAWQGFRLLANIILVASMLAIVYAQARGEQ